MCCLFDVLRYLVSNASASSDDGCFNGLTSLNPTAAASVSHHLLFGICGSRLFQLASDLNLPALRIIDAGVLNPPPFSVLGYFDVGSVKGSFAAAIKKYFSLYWSRVHSETLPSISNSPQALGFFKPVL